MLKSSFIEDIFVDFFDLVDADVITLQAQDYSAASSFYHVLIDNKELTQNQGNYLLKILQKYKFLSASAGLDYQSVIENPTWKNKFRVIDLTKKLFIRVDENNSPEVCIKFPYQLKKQFEDEFENNLDSRKTGSVWDPDEKFRVVSIYNINLIQLYEFATKHNFVIDETFMIALGQIEEIWQHSENLIPLATVNDGQILLENANSDSQEYFDSKKTDKFLNNALLAKSMGYPLNITPVTAFEKIICSKENVFWVKDNNSLFSFYKEIDGKICIILDRTANNLDWIQKFVADADQLDIPREHIRVCFRENKDSKTGLNEWVKTAGVGGKVEDGRILIFEFKPAKWLFKNADDVKMLVSNNLYPSTNSIARDWLSTHPCVIYLGDIKPSEQKGHKIVEL
jgi:hypothetical protein